MAGIREYSNLKYGSNFVNDNEINNQIQFQYNNMIKQTRGGMPVVSGGSAASGILKNEHQSQQQQQYHQQEQYQRPPPPPPHYQYVNSERDFTLPLQKHRNVQPIYESPEEEISVRKYVGVTVGIVSLITENLLSHPFLVLRRQCQVHHNSNKYHLVPFTLVPVIVHLHQRQGVTTLWKGLGSCLLVRGMSLAVEDVISKFTPWPKEVYANATMKQFAQHIVLKCVSYAVVLPFYSASLVETVQSDIASEKPGIFDVFREGANRLISWSVPQKGRMLPIWALLGPSISLSLSKYIFGLAMKGISTRVLLYRIKNKQEQRGARSRDLSTQNHNIEIYSTLFSLVTTEILFYPFETILHRLQLQGTRTIIDNLDTGYSVIPILTSYEGAIDCYKQTYVAEGVSGLYKGFGAMVLQFAAHVAVIKLTKWIVTQIVEICSTNKQSVVVVPSITALTTGISSSFKKNTSNKNNNNNNNNHTNTFSESYYLDNHDSSRNSPDDSATSRSFSSLSVE